MIHIILSLLSHNFSGHLFSNVEAFLWVSLLESTQAIVYCWSPGRKYFQKQVCLSLTAPRSILFSLVPVYGFSLNFMCTNPFAFQIVILLTNCYMTYFTGGILFLKTDLEDPALNSHSDTKLLG